MVKNYMEILVDEALDEILFRETPDDTSKQYTDICKCAQCIEDMKAITLNHVKPFYVTGKKGEIFGEYSKLNFQYRADIIRETIAAINFVIEHKHGR